MSENYLSFFFFVLQILTFFSEGPGILTLSLLCFSLVCFSFKLIYNKDTENNYINIFEEQNLKH